MTNKEYNVYRMIIIINFHRLVQTGNTIELNILSFTISTNFNALEKRKYFFISVYL